MLNVPRTEFNYFTEIRFILEELNISESFHIFRDEVNLHQLNEEGKLSVTLVGSNVLSRWVLEVWSFKETCANYHLVHDFRGLGKCIKGRGHSEERKYFFFSYGKIWAMPVLCFHFCISNMTCLDEKFLYNWPNYNFKQLQILCWRNVSVLHIDAENRSWRMEIEHEIKLKFYFSVNKM